MKSAHSFLVPVLLLFLAIGAQAQVKGYYRFPTIHDNTVVFTAEGDLWRVPATGGVAMRLTSHDGGEAFARFSPDGNWIAFSAEYHGNQDVYVMPSAGGEPERLTYHPAADQVVAWKPDSASVVFRSMRCAPNLGYELFEVPQGGGHPTRIEVGVASLASFSGDGKWIAFNRFSLEFATWKRYRGGTAQEIWVGDLERKSFRKVTDWPGTDRFPMWYESRICFLTDRTGRLNIFSMNPDGTDARQITHHTEYDARWPDLHGHRIVYMHAGDLWLLDLENATSRCIDITLPSDRIRHRPRVEDAARTVESYGLSPDGKRIVVSSRGELWNCSGKKGRIIELTRSPGIRERSPVFSPEGDRIACITDETGEQELALVDAAGKNSRRIVTHRGKGWIFPPVWSPDSRKLAYADLTMTLFVVDIEAGEITPVDSCRNQEIREYAFSPDGKWLAYTKVEDNNLASIYLFDIAEKKSFPLTTPFSSDHSPTWDRDGKYLFFLSDRNFNPIVGNMDLQHLVTSTARPYALILARDGKSPFLPDELLEEEGEKKDNNGKKQPEQEVDGKAKPAVAEITLDLDGIVDRVVAFPVPAGNYAALGAIAGKVFYLSYPTPGLMDMLLFAEDRAPRFTLHAFDLKEKKAEVFVDKVRDYTLSHDGTKIAYRVGMEILVASTAAKPAAAPTAGDGARLNPSALRLEVQPAAEWAQIFAEAWRLQRDFYWAENLGRVDWPAMRAKYEKLLPRVSTRRELNDLIGELIGELGTSHAYVFGGDMKRAGPVGVGLLGADLTPDPRAGAHRFVRVLRPEVWDTELEAPLIMTHARVSEGDYLFAVNGVDLVHEDNVHAALANLAGQEVLLTVGRKPDRSDARDIQIKTLISDAALRYRDWCRRNREFVDRMSEGRVGYFHMPDMMGSGLVEFIKGFYPQVNKEGLIIDVRYNGGGFVSSMMIERLQRTVIGYNQPRRGPSSTYPRRVHAGHKAVLINQFSGSDGDVFPAAFKRSGIGPLIGMRTWGGVVGIRVDKRFIDGGLSTQPEYAFWFPDCGWDIENHGVEPDIEVDILPEDSIAGRDPQLETALAELDRMMKQKPVERPALPPLPDKTK